MDRAFKAILSMGLIILIVYGIAFFAVSTTSQERVLDLREEKRFCGLYLDCHLAASVESVKQMKTIGQVPQQKTASGVYYIVTVKIRSDAMRATMSFDHPVATVIDARGEEYQRALEAEAVLDAAQGRAVPFEQTLGPGGYFFTKKLVFDLPTDVDSPQLLLSKGGRLERLTELFLIGDEDSWLHKKVKFRLIPSAENQ